MHIIPLIKEGLSKTLINKAIQETIIDPIHHLLEVNILNLCSDEIHGMLYFLTGNCHLKWK